jgi:hypothetical protein
MRGDGPWRGYGCGYVWSCTCGVRARARRSSGRRAPRSACRSTPAPAPCAHASRTAPSPHHHHHRSPTRPPRQKQNHHNDPAGRSRSPRSRAGRRRHRRPPSKRGRHAPCKQQAAPSQLHVLDMAEQSILSARRFNSHSIGTRDEMIVPADKCIESRNASRARTEGWRGSGAVSVCTHGTRRGRTAARGGGGRLTALIHRRGEEHHKHMAPRG